MQRQQSQQSQLRTKPDASKNTHMTSQGIPLQQASVWNVMSKLRAGYERFIPAADNELPEEKTLFVTFVNTGFVVFVRNMLCSLLRWNLRVLVFSAQRECCTELYALGMPRSVACRPISSSNQTLHPTGTASTFGSSNYNALLRARLNAYASIVASRHDALFIDADVVVVSDPRPLLAYAKQSNASFVFMTTGPANKDGGCPDGLFPNGTMRVLGNGGFYFARGDRLATEVMRAALRRLTAGLRDYDGTDQGALHVAIRERRAPVAFFDCVRAVNGRNFFTKRTDHTRASVVHATYMLGAATKRECLEVAGMWLVPAQSASNTDDDLNQTARVMKHEPSPRVQNTAATAFAATASSVATVTGKAAAAAAAFAAYKAPGSSFCRAMHPATSTWPFNNFTAREQMPRGQKEGRILRCRAS